VYLEGMQEAIPIVVVVVVVVVVMVVVVVLVAGCYLTLVGHVEESILFPVPSHNSYLCL